jgi:hypothetical protein
MPAAKKIEGKEDEQQGSAGNRRGFRRIARRAVFLALSRPQAK